VQTVTSPNEAGISAETMNRLLAAAEEYERLRPRLDAARTELHAAIRQAHAEGVKDAAIARMAGLSRERIRQIVSKPS
jgi:hypothetical protein